MVNKARWFVLFLILGMYTNLIFSQVLISEIMYHPQEVDLPYPDYEDREDAEFIEIWNSGSNSIDVSFYMLEGISYCFPSGTILNPDQRIVLVKDSLAFQEVFGGVSFGEYEGKLSNTGEKIKLFDNQGLELHRVNYRDSYQWPSKADGLGHSLELICSTCDTEKFSNWIASKHPNGHTARNPNSLFVSSNYPAIDSIVLNDHQPDPGQVVTVQVYLADATSVSLGYTVNYGTTITLTGTIQGNMASFSLPPFAAGDIVHYFVTAEKSNHIFSMPRTDDILPNYSFIVNNPNRTPSNFPIIDWYYDAATPDSALTTLAYEGQVISNAFAWWRRNKHWRVELPKGQEFSMDGYTTLTVDEFQFNRPDHMFGWWVNGTMARTAVFTNIISEAGEPRLDAFNVRVDENGQYGKIWTYLTWPDGNWRDHVGITEGHEYFKFPSTIVPGTPNPDIKYPAGGDNASINALMALADSVGPHLMDVYDIPRMVNFAALSTIICHWDAGLKNFYMHKHPNGRWEGDIWDVDASPRTGVAATDSTWCKCAELSGMAPGLVTPAGNPVIPHPNNAGNMFAKPLIANNTRVKNMYYRRLRTLIDKYYAPGEMMSRVVEQADSTDPDILYTAASYSANHNIAEHQKNIYVDYPAWQLPRYDAKPGFPPSATGVTDIIFNEIQYAPVGGDGEEFIELYNRSTESVDLTGWKIEGIGLELPPGTVILPQDFLVVASWSPTFIAKYGSGKYVAADFKGSRLNNSGETLRLLDTGGVVIDLLTYQQTSWKGAHGGPSLERISYTGASDDPSNWAPSTYPFGTPDAPNNADPTADYPPAVAISNIIINEIMYHADTLNALKGKALDFIEIINNNNMAVDVSGLELNGIDYVFPSGTLLQANEIIVIAANPHAFSIKYGFEPFDTYNGSLDNDGESLAIIDPSGYVIDSLTYNDRNPWDEDPDGNGPSLELLSPTMDNAEPLSWFRSDNLGGTPGAKNSRICNDTAQSIVINEINYNSNNNINDPGDWVELHNPNAATVDLSGWTFYDNNNEFILPSGTVLEPGSFLVLTEDDGMFSSVFPNVPSNKILGNFAFGLSNKGERISLFNENKCLSDYVIFNDRFPWDTLPDGNGPTLSLITPNSDNAIPQSWEASTNITAPLGTPGRANVPCPTFNIMQPDSICKGDPMLFHTTPDNDVNFTWTVQGGTPATASGDSVFFVFQSIGLAIAELEYTYYECSNVIQELITVEECNTAPTPQIDNYTIDEDSTFSANVLTNDSDPENQPLTVSLITDVNNGNLTLNSDGSFTFIPTPNYYGSDNFIYEVCDNFSPALCATELVNIIINSVNDAPVTTTDLYNGIEDNQITGNVLINDSDIEGNALNSTLFSSPTFGTVTLLVAGSFTYTPNSNYFGTDAFVYEVCDDGTPSICLTEIVNIIISPVNDPPITALDSFTVNEDNTLSDNVLTNDQEVENQLITSSLVSNVSDGNLSLNPDGSFIYLPNSNYYGVDSFNYESCDDDSPPMCALETVLIDVQPINDLPIVRSDTLETDEGVQVSGNASTNDYDVETSPMSYTLLSFTQNGSILFNFDGSFYYTPFVGFSGIDSFQYKACDNGSPNYCDTATVYLEVIKDCATLDISLFLEGAYDTQTTQMSTTLNTVRAVLPGMTANPISGQPYNSAPWNYLGTEGTDYTNTDYAATVVDWVLISLRTDLDKSTEVHRMAGLLHADGQISFPGECLSTNELSESYYIIAEHRNHMAVMSSTKVSLNNRVLHWDFRLADSYAIGGSGAKELSAGVWGLYAGDCNQLEDLISYDINGKDKSSWLLDNGRFGVYLTSDIDMNGDVTGADKALWLLNNGVFSSVKK